MKFKFAGFLVGASLACAATTTAAVEAYPTVTKRADFPGVPGAKEPQSTLVSAGGGLFYGTTSSGGTEDYGTLYSFNSITGAISTLFSFGVGNFGSTPYAPLIPVGGGIYYGTTSSGGTGGYGAIFKFDSTTGAVTEAASCDGSNCDGLYSGLVVNPLTGRYYGTSYYGASGYSGGIYEFDPGNGAITQKAGCTDGDVCEYFYAPLAWDGARQVFYGASVEGGEYSGSIVSFDPATNALELRAECLDTAPGGEYQCYELYSGLVQAGNGLFYGTSYYGGQFGEGSIYSFNPATNELSLAASFDGVNGESPYYGSLALGDDGLLYGATYYGGTAGTGAVYSFNPDDNSISLIASLSGANGEGPNGGLVNAGDGTFYGTTGFGGAIDDGWGNGTGTVYQLQTTEPVPGPLPAMGAALAYGWSRRLRRRLRQAGMNGDPAAAPRA